MSNTWQNIARRIVEGVGVEPGELIQVRCSFDRFDIMQEILLAVELAGATPLPEITPPAYLQRLIAEASPDYLARWEQHRQEWMKQFDRIIVLQGHRTEFETLPPTHLSNWRQATERLVTIEEERRLPNLVVGIPTETRAQQLGLTLTELDEMILPALSASITELQNQISRALTAIDGGTNLTIRSGSNYELHLQLGNRPWLSDDGYIDNADRARGAIVSNLPAGSIYTTVLEEKTEGSLWFPKVGQSTNVIFQFEQGRIVKIEAESGAEILEKMFDSHSGEPRRISHIGLGLNPYLNRAINWVMVDEHIYGSLFVALGENRYMGGQNESSLNIDFSLQNASLSIDGRTILSEGKLKF